MPHLLTIDLGTSSVKALLVSETGQILSSGSAGHPIHHPQSGHVEQNPRDWMWAVAEAVRQILTGVKNKAGSVSAIGLTGQMHGTVLFDMDHELVTPAVIWPDQRSQRQVEEIIALLGREQLVEITGGSVATGFQAATLRWFQQQQPDVWQRVRLVLLPKDYSGKTGADPGGICVHISFTIGYSKRLGASQSATRPNSSHAAQSYCS